MSQEQLQLQISLTIGTQRFLIKVPKQTNLQNLIRKFLINNHLNPKYQSSIINLVKDKLAKAQQDQIPSPHKIMQKSPFKKPVKTQHSTEENKNKKVINQTVNNNKTKQFINSKINKEIAAKERDVSPDSRRLYEQWKQRQKEKNQHLQKRQTIHKKQSKLWVPLNKQRHSPDYFYKKGLNFQQKCKNNDQDNFKKLYPFKIKEMQLSQEQQAQLYNRLYRGRQYENKRQCRKEDKSQFVSQKQQVLDPIKQHVKQQDSKIDKEIFKMIKEGSLTFLQKKRSVSKSPFRKTIFN